MCRCPPPPTSHGGGGTRHELWSWLREEDTVRVSACVRVRHRLCWLDISSAHRAACVRAQGSKRRVWERALWVREAAWARVAASLMHSFAHAERRAFRLSFDLGWHGERRRATGASQEGRRARVGGEDG